MRIISWNIQWGRGADGKVDLDRTIAAIREMGDADVICLQEVAQGLPDISGSRTDGPEILASAFPQHEAIFGPGIDVPGEHGGRARFGNLMLSASPVGQVFRRLLPFPADGAVPGMQRACLEAVLHPPGGPLRMLTTHLEYFSARQREAQVRALREIQQESVDHAALRVSKRAAKHVFAPRPRPLAAVICGDFNFRPDSTDHRLMGEPPERAESGWVDAWEVARNGLPHHPTVGLHGAEWPREGERYCCDFFWVSRNLAPRIEKLRVNAQTAASDHQPVVLEFKW